MEVLQNRLRQAVPVTLVLYLFFSFFGRVQGVPFVDFCKSLSNNRLRVGADNVVLDEGDPKLFNNDVGRFKRDSRNDGVLTYKSSKGFKHVRVFGYVFGEVDEWSIELRGGANGSNTKTLVEVDKTNIGKFERSFNVSGDTTTEADKWIKFVVELQEDDLDCPLVLQVVLKGYASTNGYPGWALQVGRVALHESVYTACEPPPECVENSSVEKNWGHICFGDKEATTKKVKLMVDNANTLNNPLEFRNMQIDDSNHEKFFVGDAGRFKRVNNGEGRITYSIPRGITMLEVVAFFCTRNEPTLTVIPYSHPDCRVIELSPRYLKDTSTGDCWRRRTLKVDFRNVVDCPPKFVDLVIQGGQQGWELQIAEVKLHGFGALEAGRVGGLAAEEVAEAVGSSKGGRSDRAFKIWMPIIVLAGLLVFLVGAIVIVQYSMAWCSGSAGVMNPLFALLPAHWFERKGSKPSTRQFPTVFQIPSNRVLHSVSGYRRSRSLKESDSQDEPVQGIEGGGDISFSVDLKGRRETDSENVEGSVPVYDSRLFDMHNAFLESNRAISCSDAKAIQLEELIGAGALGKVWRGQWGNTPVAVKVYSLNQGMTREEELARMKLMESIMAERLSHPNLVQMFTCDMRQTTDETPTTQTAEGSQVAPPEWMTWQTFMDRDLSMSFVQSSGLATNLELRLVMEYCDAGSLVEAIHDKRFILQSGGVNMEHVILTALDIARGMQCLHEASITHGDLKPKSILLKLGAVDSRGFVAKVAECGMSTQHGGAGVDANCLKQCTRGCVAPEVTDWGQPSQASDVFSFGLVMWELYTGTCIQDDVTPPDKLSQMVLGGWRPSFPSGCPEAFSTLAASCWNSSPAHRPDMGLITGQLQGQLGQSVFQTGR